MRKLLLLWAMCWSTALFGASGDDVVTTNDFSHSVQIDVAGYAGDSRLDIFPVLVRVGGHIPGFSMQMMRSPSDIAFFGEDGLMLSSEFDCIDQNGTALYWVRVALNPVKDGCTRIFMCFHNKLDDYHLYNGLGDSASTWLSCFGVWHMGEEFGIAKDSTDESLDASVGRESHAAEMRGWPDGAVGSARVNQSADLLAGAYLSVDEFSRVELPNEYSEGGLGSAFSFSGWFRANDIPADASPRLVSCMSSFHDNGGWEVSATGTNTLSVRTGTADGYSSFASVTCARTLVGEWNLLNFSFDGSTLRVYQNGIELADGYGISAVRAINGEGAPVRALCFGCDSDGDAQSWNGQYDELRLYREATSADWAKAEYDTVANPGFLAYGAVDGNSDAPRFAGRPVVAKGQTDSDFVFSVTLEHGKADVFAVFTDVLTGETFTNQIAAASSVSAPANLTFSVPAMEAGHAYDYSAYAVATAIGEDGEYELTALAKGENAFSYGSYQVSPDLYGMRLAFVATRYSGDQTDNRQVLVRLGEDISGFSYGDFAFPGTGADIFFTDSSGASIPHEIERWNPSGESLVRVRLPSLATNAVFYAYYLGPEAAGDHAAVWEGGTEPADGEPELFSCAAGVNIPDAPVVVPTGVTGIENGKATLGFYVVSLGDGSAPTPAYVACSSLDGEYEATKDLGTVPATGAFSCELENLSPVVGYSYSLVVSHGLSEVSGRFVTKGLVEFSNVTFASDANGLTATCSIDDVGCGEADVVCYVGTDAEDMFELGSVTTNLPGEISFTFPYEDFLSDDYGLEWIVVFRAETSSSDGRVLASASSMARCVLPAGMVWTGDVSSDWCDGDNWHRGIAPVAPNLEPVFSTAGGTVESTNSVSCGAISFDAAGPVALDFNGMALSSPSMSVGGDNGCSASLLRGRYEVSGSVSVTGANGGSLTIGRGALLSASGLAGGASSKIRFEIPYGGFGGVPLEVSGNAAFDPSARIEIVANGGIVGRNVMLRAGSIAGLDPANVSVAGHPACELKVGPATVEVVASGFHFFVR